MAVALLTQTRRALLGLLYGLPDRAFYLREIAARVGSGMGQVQRELGRLTRAGIFRRFEQGRQVYYQAERRCPIFEELRALVAKTMAGSDHLRRALAELEDRIAVAFVFGSVARGDDWAESVPLGADPPERFPEAWAVEADGQRLLSTSWTRAMGARYTWEGPSR